MCYLSELRTLTLPVLHRSVQKLGNALKGVFARYASGYFIWRRWRLEAFLIETTSETSNNLALGSEVSFSYPRFHV
jgi:hypothetical protein